MNLDLALHNTWSHTVLYMEYHVLLRGSTYTWCCRGSLLRQHMNGSQLYKQNSIHIVKKRRLTSVLSFHCCVGLPLCWKAFSENTTPHQQHWANSVQKSPRQPLVHDWLGPLETLMMLNRHRSKYRERFVQGWIKICTHMGNRPDLSYGSCM